MMTTRTQQLSRMTALVLAAGVGTGCVGLNVLGFPLGPQQEAGMEITGALAPLPNTCNFAAALANPVTLVESSMELGPGTTFANRYRAVLNVVNTRDTNESNQTRQTNGPYQGNYGSEDSTGITVIAANMRYEYPTLPPGTRLTSQQIPPSDGFLFQAKTHATGTVAPASAAAITTEIINPELGQALFENQDFKDAMANDGTVPVVARVRLEGRTGAGFRAVSNEFALVVNVVPTGEIRNCARDPANTAQFLCLRDNTVTGVPLGQCFPDQDIPFCGGCPGPGE